MRLFYLLTLISGLSFSLQAQHTVAWVQQYHAPMTDPLGNLLTSTEVVDIISHKETLVAITSNWNNPYFPFIGQVLVKKTVHGEWELDEQMSGFVSRASSVKSVIFQNDQYGNPLDIPDTLLFIGLTAHKVNQASYPGKVAWRNDAGGEWTYADLAYTDHPFGRTEVRSMGSYRDKVTKADMVFAGATPAPVGIFAGRYDPALPEKIRWDTVAEFLPVNFERVLGFAECNGALYAATKSRILRRNDGPTATPRWVELIDFKDPKYLSQYARGIYSKYAFDEDIRSFRTYVSPQDGKQTLLFTTFNRLFHFNPSTQTLAEEINLKNLLDSLTEKKYNYIQSGTIADVPTPEGHPVLWIGIEGVFDTAFLSENPQPHFNELDSRGLILERRETGGALPDYQLHVISDPHSPTDTLTRVRGICPSPFLEEPNAVYAGGFAPWGAKVEDTGWIYRGQMSSPTPTRTPTHSPFDVGIYPNPSDGIFRLQGADLSRARIAVYDLSGTRINVPSTSETIDLRGFPSGIYFVVFEMEGSFRWCVEAVSNLCR